VLGALEPCKSLAERNNNKLDEKVDQLHNTLTKLCPKDDTEKGQWLDEKIDKDDQKEGQGHQGRWTDEKTDKDDPEEGQGYNFHDLDQWQDDYDSTCWWSLP
jgi:hypothetical protein